MHIVFQQEDVNTLKKSFELDESLRDDIVEIRDDYAVGPINDIYSEEGIEQRKDWWRNVLSENENAINVDSGYVNDPKAVEEIKEKLTQDENEKAWIWIAPNKHDVSGYYWIISQLKDFSGKIQVLWLNNLPFINEKGNIFYPENLFEIPAKEFLKAKKLARTVTPSEFEIDPDEWTRLGNENKTVRILEGAKKLSQFPEDFYDKYLMEFISPDWQKVNKIIQQYLSKGKHKTGDAFLTWRLREMQKQGKIDISGELKNRKEAEVKLTGVSSDNEKTETD